MVLVSPATFRYLNHSLTVQKYHCRKQQINIEEGVHSTVSVEMEHHIEPSFDAPQATNNKFI